MTPDTLELHGKVAIITGSGKETGIGARIATTLARNGALVVINHVSDTTAPRAVGVVKAIRDMGGKAIVVQADVSTAEGAKSLVDETRASLNVDNIDIIGQFPLFLSYRRD
jgi:NAD(P)-dependent dehydrogenase (short-subunit alcohol dehydrogenase family)